MRPFARGAVAGASLALVVGAALLVYGAITPSDEFLFVPTPAREVAPVVTVAGESADPPSGGEGFLFTAVSRRRASRLETWLPFLRGDHDELVPEQALIPPGGSEEEQDRADKAAMTDSQRTAAAVALRTLGRDVRVTTRGVRIDDTAIPGGSPARDAGLRGGDVIVAIDGVRVETLRVLRQELSRKAPGDEVVVRYRRDGAEREARFALRAAPDDPQRAILGIGASDDLDIRLPVDVRYRIGDVEGPSAGLAFALEVYAALTGRELTRGHRVAVTGALEIGGAVEPVGGAEQKAAGAGEAGADVFLVPRDNLAEAQAGAPEGMRVIPVDDFASALEALRSLPAE